MSEKVESAPCLFDPRKDCFCSNCLLYERYVRECTQFESVGEAVASLRAELEKLSPKQIQLRIASTVIGFGVDSRVVDNCIQLKISTLNDPSLKLQ